MANRISKNRQQARLKLGGLDDPQSTKTVAKVRRRDESREAFKARKIKKSNPTQQDNSDIDAVFRGVQQSRGMVRRGMSGQVLNPDGTDPGNSFDRFMRQNPHLQGASASQARSDQQARDIGYQKAAQNSLMRSQGQQPAPQSVVGGDGYRSIFDGSGKAVGTTAPVGNGQARVFDDALGEMVPMNTWSQQRNYVQGTKGMQPSGMQQAAQRSVGSKPSGMDQIFGGGAKQPSPSGVAGGGVVEPPQLKGAPGGELFGQMPEFKSAGMPAGQPYPPNAEPQYTPMMPNDGPQRPADFGPQLPYSGGEQLMALKRLYGFGGDTNPTLTALKGTWSNIFPGVKDYEYLRQLFPGLVHPQAGSGQVMSSLAQMYQNPAYQALFPQVNQSEFYK